MRDIKRMDNFLEEIKKVWVQYPDLRFGQLMTIFQKYCDGDFFNLEEEDFIKKLKKEFEIIEDKEYYVVHSFISGIYIGELDALEKDRTVLLHAKRITDLGSRKSLFELAKFGPSENTTMTEMAEKIIIGPASEAICCSKETIEKFFEDNKKK